MKTNRVLTSDEYLNLLLERASVTGSASVTEVMDDVYHDLKVQARKHGQSAPHIVPLSADQLRELVAYCESGE